jgi:hypothetical protein
MAEFVLFLLTQGYSYGGFSARRHRTPLALSKPKIKKCDLGHEHLDTFLKMLDNCEHKGAA